MDQPKPRNNNDSPPIRTIRPGAAPSCLAAGFVPCRGCPGWLEMRRALDSPQSGWREIHCGCTGLIVGRTDQPDR